MIFAIIYDVDQAYYHAEGGRSSLFRSAGERGDIPASWRGRVSYWQFCYIGDSSVALSTILSLGGLHPVCRSLGQDARGRMGEASQKGSEEPVSKRLSLRERRGLVGALKVRNNVCIGRVVPWPVMQSALRASCETLTARNTVKRGRNLECEG